MNLASWLNFTIRGCKKRNVLYEKMLLIGPKKMGNSLGFEKKKNWGKKKGFLEYKDKKLV